MQKWFTCTNLYCDSQYMARVQYERDIITANEINTNYGFMQDEVGDLADYTKTADDEVADKGTCTCTTIIHTHSVVILCIHYYE